MTLPSASNNDFIDLGLEVSNAIISSGVSTEKLRAPVLYLNPRRLLFISLLPFLLLHCPHYLFVDTICLSNDTSFEHELEVSASVKSTTIVPDTVTSDADVVSESLSSIPLALSPSPLLASLANPGLLPVSNELPNLCW